MNCVLDVGKLENPFFTGQAKCDLAQNPINKIKDILNIKEKSNDR